MDMKKKRIITVIMGVIALALGLFAGFFIETILLEAKERKEFEGFVPAEYECTIDITDLVFKQMFDLPDDSKMPDSVADFKSKITVTLSLYEDGTGYMVCDLGQFSNDFTDLVTNHYLDFMQLVVESEGEKFDRNAKDHALANKNTMMKVIKENIIDSLSSTSSSVNWKRYGYTLLLEEDGVYTEYTLNADWAFDLTDVADTFGADSIMMERVK